MKDELFEQLVARIREGALFFRVRLLSRRHVVEAPARLFRQTYLLICQNRPAEG